MMNSKISQLDADSLQEWNRFVDASPHARIYHRAEWAALIKEVFGHESLYLYARDQNSAIAGVLPLIAMRSALFGNFCISMPYFNYGGAVANTDDLETALMQYAANVVDSRKYQFIEYRDDKSRDGWLAKQDKITMMLELLDDPEAMFAQLKSKVRSQIRRPMREDVTVEFGAEELLDDFYLAFTTNMRDLGTPPYTKTFFQEILRRFPENAYLAIVRKGSAVAGGAFLLGYKDTLEIPWASTIRRYNPLGVNMLMYWEIIKSAIERGYSYFDFGRCSKDAGTYRFKKQWGSEEKQLYWHYSLLQGNELPQINPNNAKYKLFIETWKKLPLPVTRLIGPHIVRNIP